MGQAMPAEFGCSSQTWNVSGFGFYQLEQLHQHIATLDGDVYEWTDDRGAWVKFTPRAGRGINGHARTAVIILDR